MLQSINGGVLFIRPCAATEQVRGGPGQAQQAERPMLQSVGEGPALPAGAEQLQWCKPALRREKGHRKVPEQKHSTRPSPIRSSQSSLVCSGVAWPGLFLLVFVPAFFRLD